MVGALEALAHPCKPARRLFEMAVTWPDDLDNGATRPSSTYRTARPLRPSDVDGLVDAYRAGTNVTGLAAQFGIHRETAGKYLQARGIDTRDIGFGPEKVQEAAELYREGWSLARLEEKYGVDDMTVRARLLEIGVVMRARRGGRRSVRQPKP